MSENQMTVLTRDSIIELRVLADTDPKIVWEQPLDRLIADYQLKTVDVDVQYLRGFEFRSGLAGDRQYDRQNAETLWGALHGLTPSQATDERIWTTLALGDYKDYVLRRWAKMAKLEDAISSKVFVKNTRSLIRDHSIARLWWRVYFATVAPRSLSADPLHLFFEHEDIPGEIAGRSILADTRVRSFYISTLEQGLKALSEGDSDGDTTIKKYIQGVGKHLNFLSGRFQLGAVSDGRLRELMDIAHGKAIEPSWVL